MMNRIADNDISGFPGEDCFVNDFACDIHDNNTLAILPDVASLEECRLLCQDTANCSYITHYSEDSSLLITAAFSIL